MTTLKEPWTLDGSDIRDDEGNLIDVEAHLRRIVACVNYCRRLPTDFIEDGFLSSPKFEYEPYDATRS